MPRIVPVYRKVVDGFEIQGLTRGEMHLILEGLEVVLVRTKAAAMESTVASGCPNGIMYSEHHGKAHDVEKLIDSLTVGMSECNKLPTT